MKRFAVAFLLIVGTGFGLPDISAATLPTPFEQYQLELINRARADPQAEVTRLSGLTWDGTPALNEGLAPGTITPDAKQPLAFHIGTTTPSVTPGLVGVARTYGSDLIAANQFTHTLGGTTSNGRMTAGGYAFSPLPAGSGENLSAILSSGTLLINTPNTESLNNNLFVDSGVAGRGHRLALMDPDFREIGIGLASGGPYLGFNSGVVAVQDFGFTNSNAFLTGVAYNEALVVPNDDVTLYTPGEQITDVNVNAFNGSMNFNTNVYSTSGGYALQLPNGTYTVTFTSPTHGTQIFNNVVVNGQNVKLDFIASPIPEPSTWAMMVGGLVLAGFAVRRRAAA